jgi:hypothetical protein
LNAVTRENESVKLDFGLTESTLRFVESDVHMM